MARYIDVNSFLEYEENRCKNSPPLIGTCSFDNATLRGELVNFPAADVEPVRHGHWIEHDEDTWSNEAECSECHKRIGYSGLPDRFLKEFKYCPNCGAKMEEDTKC